MADEYRKWKRGWKNLKKREKEGEKERIKEASGGVQMGKELGRKDREEKDVCIKREESTGKERIRYK